MLHQSGSLVPRPLPVFNIKNWEWPGDEATNLALFLSDGNNQL